jgi:hypothetical protein
MKLIEVSPADKALMRKIKKNARNNRAIQSQIELYRALHGEAPYGEYLKSLSLILFGFGAATVKDLAGGTLSEACHLLAFDYLGRRY